MTAEEYESLTGGIVLNTVKLERGEMSVVDYVKAMKVIFGKEIFKKTIEILDEE